MSHSAASTSGKKLLLWGALAAVLPVILEVLSDGGSGHFGDAETGQAMVISGFFLWPLALTLIIIGLKRWYSSLGGETSATYQAPIKTSEHAGTIRITDAWHGIDASHKEDAKR